MYTEHIAFPVDEELLRQLATGYAPAKPVIWRFKLLAKSGPEYRGGLSNAEIAGFLAKVDEYTPAQLHSLGKAHRRQGKHSRDREPPPMHRLNSIWHRRHGRLPQLRSSPNGQASWSSQ